MELIALRMSFAPQELPINCCLLREMKATAVEVPRKQFAPDAQEWKEALREGGTFPCIQPPGDLRCVSRLPSPGLGPLEYWVPTNLQERH